MQIITLVLVIFAILVLITLAVSVSGYFYRWKWTGVVEDEEFPYKTFWDWLSLLVIPVLLALGGILFTAYQGVRQQAIEDQRMQDSAVQAYLDQMSQLMLEHNLHDAAVDSEARTLAGARTLTLLQSLDDQKHKRSVVRFLYEADLIDSPQPVVSLAGANLRDIDLEEANLGGGPFLLRPSWRGRCNLEVPGVPGSPFGGDQADLSGANLAYSDLRDSWLSGVNLEGANLTGADLRRAGMKPDFHESKGSNIRARTDVGCAVADYPLFKATEKFPYLPKGAIRTNLEGAVLSEAKLQEADLSGANLRGSTLAGADLSGAALVAADLEGALLENADLSGANLTRARVTPKQLNEVKSLEGATMPDGT